MGGTITPDARLAYYAKPLAALSLNDSFSASGKIVVGQGGGNTLLGFFNPATSNEWRMANSLVFRLFMGVENTFQLHFEYGTSLWRAGAGMFPDYFKRYHLLLVINLYPVGEDSGEITVIQRPKATCTLSPGHRGDGAVFTHFGLLKVLKHPDDTGHLWIDEVVINGIPEDFSMDPGWDAFQTQDSYLSEDTRPRFAFGYSGTQFAGGAIPGEIGGRFFR